MNRAATIFNCLPAACGLAFIVYAAPGHENWTFTLTQACFVYLGSYLTLVEPFNKARRGTLSTGATLVIFLTGVAGILTELNANVPLQLKDWNVFFPACCIYSTIAMISKLVFSTGSKADSAAAKMK